jgi:hypothetical protein
MATLSSFIGHTSFLTQLLHRQSLQLAAEMVEFDYPPSSASFYLDVAGFRVIRRS